MFSPAYRSISTRNLRYTGGTNGRSRSPGHNLFSCTGGAGYWGEPMYADLSRVYTTSHVSSVNDATVSYLRKPVEPQPAKSPQFHRPSRTRSPAGGLRSRSASCGPYKSKPGMFVLVEQLHSATPRPRSPHMNNEEPIELSHYPDARKLGPNEKMPIERDDFPAPPYPYVDHALEVSKGHRIRHHSAGSTGKMSTATTVGDVNDVASSIATSELAIDPDSTGEAGESDYSSDIDDDIYIDPKLKLEEEELSKIASGIGAVFLKNIKEREKLDVWKKSHLDPRKSSRAPSAKMELPRKLRYENPVNASPSRDADRIKPWEEEGELDLVPVFRSHPSGSCAPAYPMPVVNRQVVSALRYIPKPGYGFRSLTPATSTSVVDSPAIASSVNLGQLNKPTGSDTASNRNVYYSQIDAGAPRTSVTLPASARIAGGPSEFVKKPFQPNLQRQPPPQQQQQQQYLQDAQPACMVKTQSGDLSSGKSDYSIQSTDLYTASGQKRYLSTAAGHEEGNMMTATISKDTIASASTVGRTGANSIALMGGGSSGPRYSGFGGHRSATPGGQSSVISGVSVCNTGRFTASSANEPTHFVSSIDYDMKDYDSRGHILHSAASEYPTANSLALTAMTPTFSDGASLIAVKSTHGTPHHVPMHFHQPNYSQRDRQKQFKLSGYSNSTTASGRDDTSYTDHQLAAHLRRSMPNVNMHSCASEPAVQHQYYTLMTTNYRLPPNVDRCHLERHLSTDEFVRLFHMSRMEFYRLPEWKRNELKKRVRLF